MGSIAYVKKEDYEDLINLAKEILKYSQAKDIDYLHSMALKVLDKVSE